MLDMSKLIDKEKRYYIYGVTNLAKFAYDRITGEFGEDMVKGFIQTSPKIESYCGKRVYNVRHVKEYIHDSDMIVLASKNKSDEMRDQLLECGIPENAMLSIKDYWFVGNYISGRQIRNLFIWPSLKKRNLDLTDKVKWFMPEKINVWVYSSDKEVMSDLADAGNVEFIDDEEKAIKNADYIYVWDAGKIGESLKEYMDKVIVVDPNFYYQKDIYIYGNTYYNSLTKEEKETYAEHSKKVMLKMQKEFCDKKRANVFCTGPSIEEIFDENFDDNVNVICNSMIKDRELMEKLNPNILTFGDVAFYISPNQYCQAFYKDLLFTFEKYHYYIIVYDYQVPLIKYHFPMLYDRLIGIKVDHVEEYHFPDDTDLYVKVTRNICTLFMIPIASVICDEVGIAGCTGRGVEENYFWKHNSNTQYLDRMHYVFEAYPAFFKYSNYEDYYELHCKCMKDLIEYGEKRGKKYINLTTSFIPVLKERFIKRREENAEGISDNTGI